MRDTLLNQAMAGFWPALAVVDPLRIEAWDNQGLTIAQLRLMSMLLFEDSRTVGELADNLDVKMPTVTGMTDRLVRMGMIERHDDPVDRRVVRIGLSEAGRRAMREIEHAGREFLAPVFERLGAQRVRDLIAVFDEFVEAARQVREESRSRLAAVSAKGAQ
jgi:DNA-binding MarR family transcriptional regulator